MLFGIRLERVPFDPLEEIFDLEGRDVDDAVEALQNVHPRRAMQRVRDRPAAQIAVAEVQRLLRLDALKTRRDQIGRLLRRHHPHIDFGAEDRGIELHVRAAFVGHRPQFLIDDLR